MFTQPNRNKHELGFSLIELVIVVVIMGIIAAIAIPRLSRGSRTAGTAALNENLAILRKANELYAIEHDGNYPDHNIANQLTQYSDFAGATFSTTKDPANDVVYGPYLKEIPPLPVGSKKGKTAIFVTTNAADTPPQGGANYGWWYNTATVTIKANLPNSNKNDDNKRFNLF